MKLSGTRHAINIKEAEIELYFCHEKLEFKGISKKISKKGVFCLDKTLNG
jgi:hypothetical protein